jgi:hypothetical protein
VLLRKIINCDKSSMPIGRQISGFRATNRSLVRSYVYRVPLQQNHKQVELHRSLRNDEVVHVNRAELEYQYPWYSMTFDCISVFCIRARLSTIGKGRTKNKSYFPTVHSTN